MTAANVSQSFKGIGSGTALMVLQATDKVAVSWMAGTSTEAGTTSLGTALVDTIDPKAVLPHSHAMLATAVLGRFPDADAHTATEQWQARTDMLALGFWNNTTTAFSNQSTQNLPMSFNTATALMEPPRDAQSGATL